MLVFQKVTAPASLFQLEISTRRLPFESAINDPMPTKSSMWLPTRLFDAPTTPDLGLVARKVVIAPASVAAPLSQNGLSTTTRAPPEGKMGNMP